jgi:hypothetical protein
VSTFGNKALVWWDYHTHDRPALLRFNSTPKDIQLKILEKWYPIGMKVGIGGNRYNYEIVEHIEHMTFWNVRVAIKAENSIMNNMSSSRNPLALYPDPIWEKQIKRQQKITRLV